MQPMEIDCMLSNHFADTDRIRRISKDDGRNVYAQRGDVEIDTAGHGSNAVRRVEIDGLDGPNPGELRF